MVFGDWDSIANAKNRAENLHLKKQLNTLEMQKCKEIAWYKNQRCKKYKKRFYMFSKVYEYPNDFVSLDSQMYSLNTAEGRFSRPQVSVDYSTIHRLIFTKGAVDIEKLLILHLISVHKSESLVPTRHRVATILKDADPTSRLVEKSKKPVSLDEIVIDLIPFYTIEISKGSTDRNVNKDSRLANRILINRNLRKLVVTVFCALHKSNFIKFQRLIQLAQNPESIKMILSNVKSKQFLESISDLILVMHPENFTLTPPFKLKTRDLNVKTPSGVLENLVDTLRNNVLQLTAPKISNTQIDSKGDYQKPSKKILYEMFEEPTPKENKLSTEISDLPITVKKSKMYIVDRPVSLTERPLNVRIPNYIQKNIEAAGKTKIRSTLVDDNEDEDLIKLPNKRASRRISSLGAAAYRARLESEEHKMRMGFLPRDALTGRAANEEEEENQLGMPEVHKNIGNSPRISLREMHQKISIEDHHIHTQVPASEDADEWTPIAGGFRKPKKKKLSVEERRRSSARYSFEKLKESDDVPKLETSSKFESVFLRTNDPVIIDSIHLAQIEQEIRQRETQKKLEKFMAESVEAKSAAKWH